MKYREKSIHIMRERKRDERDYKVFRREPEK